MYVFKNAMKNLIKMSGRNLLIGLIIVVITSLSFIALALVKTIEEVENDLMSKLKINATIIRNASYTRNSDSPLDSKKLDLNEVLMFSDVESISGFDASFEVVFNGYSAIGYTSIEYMSDFIEGKKRLIGGNFFGVDDSYAECIIASDFGSMNNYEVGDYLILLGVDSIKEIGKLKIVGIYEEDSKTYSKVITSFHALSTLAENIPDLNELSVSAIYYFDTLDKLDDFKKYLNSSGLNNKFSLIYSNIKKFMDFSNSIKTTGKFADIALMLVLLIGGSILVIFNSFQINERKYEIGVLNAIGMTKQKIISQFIIELLLMSIITVFIGILIGAIASIPVAKTLIEPQIKISGLETTEVRKLQANSEILTIEKSSTAVLFDDNTSFNSKLDNIMDFDIIIQVIGIGLLLSIISIIYSLVSILRFDPLKILNSRF